WTVVTRDGSAAAGPVAVRFGRPEGALERAADEDRLTREVATLRGEQATAEERARAAGAASEAARSELVEAASDERAAAEARRRAEDRERAVGRAAEAA